MVFILKLYFHHQLQFQKTIIKNSKRGILNYQKLKSLQFADCLRKKNIKEIIRVISQIKKDISLYVIGSGPEKKNILKLIRFLNLGNNVKLIGFKKNPYQYLIKADLYINSSYFEGFPNSVVEAAHIGLPIIASKVMVVLMKFCLKERGGDNLH